MSSNVTTATRQEVLDALLKEQTTAVIMRDVVELERLAQVYAGLGYDSEADMLVRRIAHERAAERMT